MEKYIQFANIENKDFNDRTVNSTFKEIKNLYRKKVGCLCHIDFNIRKNKNKLTKYLVNEIVKTTN